ncbi:response regulator transcription factor [Fusibacter sp. 3D3]|uniref:response regulator transcription factor n=1 Tax=Fusibacter sp. 3D3 TaxID=1048380 RepID=UPI00085331A2|nr:response regulator transcription factor [Fusibacter sp. 3D3]GAU76700.1 two-component response regulator [Fusibacter sp. 3D3]
MAVILIVEDDLNINNMIAEALTKNQYSCIQAFSGTEALLRMEQQYFDLILLDLMLPGMTGDQVIQKIKSIEETSVIIISANDELDRKVDLLSAGAEDYVTKPFEIKELLARIAVQLRRKSKRPVDTLYTHKGLSLNCVTYQVALKGCDISLTRQEFKILELLMNYPNKVFSKQDIYQYAWDEYYVGEDKTINVHISNMRQKFKKVSRDEYIETVWGIGFKLSK